MLSAPLTAGASKRPRRRAPGGDDETRARRATARSESVAAATVGHVVDTTEPEISSPGDAHGLTHGMDPVSARLEVRAPPSDLHTHATRVGLASPARRWLAGAVGFR
jgi:hypothetical protein